MENTLVWNISDFGNLSVKELYNILQLRFTVFVQGQKCLYLDPDGEDFRALHVQAYLNNELIAYCRIFKAGDHLDKASIGRVAVHPKYRGKGYGHLLISKAIKCILEEWNTKEIALSAQKYLKRFYESHGFEQTSGTYEEAGMEHIRMDLGK